MMRPKIANGKARNVFGGRVAGVSGVGSRENRALDRHCIVLFFSIFLNGFISAGNLLSLVRSVSTLGILGVGMAFLVIGAGIDLSIVAIYAMSAAWTLHLASAGVSIPLAMLLGYLLALAAGVINGVLIAYVEDPRPLRDVGHGFARLRLRALRAGPPRRGLHARQRLRHRLDRRWLCVRACRHPFCFSP